MKILIISHTRCGSTTLCKWISKELNIELDETPYDKKTFNSIFEKTNIIRKIVIEEYLPTSYIINKFDKVISLTREKSIDSSISFLIANKSDIWHNEYEVSNDWISKNEYRIIETAYKYENMKNYLKKINGFHITYETIYDKNDINGLLNYLNIKNTNYLDLLNNNKKYRKDSNTLNYDFKRKNII